MRLINDAPPLVCCRSQPSAIFPLAACVFSSRFLSISFLCLVFFVSSERSLLFPSPCFHVFWVMFFYLLIPPKCLFICFCFCFLPSECQPSMLNKDRSFTFPFPVFSDCLSSPRIFIYFFYFIFLSSKPAMGGSFSHP